MMDVLFTQTPVVESPELHVPMVAAYRPPTLVETPPVEEVWTETQDNLLGSLSAWRPLKEVSQEDLDQNLGPEAVPPPGTRSETSTPVLSEDKRQAFFKQGIPAGAESMGKESVLFDIFI